MKKVLLTKREEIFFNENGFLHLPQILSKDKTSELIKAIKRLEKNHTSSKEFEVGLDKKFTIAEDPIFLEMVDYEKTFDYILGIMGPFIQLCMSHALTRPSDIGFEGFVHTDGGQGMQEVLLKEDIRPLQVKIQYFLTDTSKENSGNFLYLPGSHKIPFPVYEEPSKDIISKMKQFKAKAGDAVIFTNALWHGATKNTSGNTRYSVIYGYNKLFMKPYDYKKVSQEFLEKCTPRQRRLLGDMGVDAPQAHYYAPRDQIKVIEGV